MTTETKKSKTYPVELDGGTRNVTVPGSGDEEPGPANEDEFETFLAESLEAYAEESDMPRPRIRTFAEAGVLTNNNGLVVRFGDAEFQLTIVRSR